MSEIPGVGDERVTISIGPLSVKGHGSVTLKVPRFGSMDIETHDALIADLEALDVEAQVIGVANDLAEAPVGTKVFWEPLLKAARKQLTDLGVVVKRTAPNGSPRDEVTCPSQKVLAALEPYSDKPVLSLPKRSREVVLAMLKHVVSAEELAVCEKCTLDQLNYIREQWQSKSSMSLGEFLASDSS